MRRENRNIVIDVLLICMLSCLFMPIISSAQSLSGLSSSITLSTFPKNPVPNSIVRITVSDVFQDLTISNITWYVDGKIVLKGVGETSVEITTGGYGSRSEIEVVVSDRDGASTSSSITIIPTQVDILLDGNTYTPPLYRGRSLPTAAGTIRLLALANFTQGSSIIADNAIIFTWRRNGQVLGSVSGRGKSSITIPSPQLFSSETISVEASSVDGKLSGSASIVTSSTDPVLALYVYHPLYGIMFNERIGSVSEVAEATGAFIAVPYFADTTSITDPDLRFAWRVNGTALAASSTHQDILTINAGSPGMKARVELSVSSRRNVFMSGTNIWNMIFATGRNVSGTGESGSDVFHSGE